MLQLITDTVFVKKTKKTIVFLKFILHIFTLLFLFFYI